MSEYLDARYYGTRTGNGKEMYTVTFNKHFRDWGLSSYINYSHQTYLGPAGQRSLQPDCIALFRRGAV
ncbi:Outer membrane usher protein papC precursor [Serratia fonticola]|uniref:Outer membrane usher protein papC n=1 Tax=Serratia fonticola TaxID=47917 RepID=A0A4U9TX80_SERFO|nr:Outer membrane usher protein papC precursor [Serratia fonticola]